MSWCSNTESVPLLVSNTHDIILVRTKYVPVCTSLYDQTFPVPVCTRYVLVRTVSLSVRTKYPDRVRPVTIPDECQMKTVHLCLRIILMLVGLLSSASGPTKNFSNSVEVRCMSWKNPIKSNGGGNISFDNGFELEVYLHFLTTC